MPGRTKTTRSVVGARWERDDTCGVCGEKAGLCGRLGRHSLSRHASDRLSFASGATLDSLCSTRAVTCAPGAKQPSPSTACAHSTASLRALSVLKPFARRYSLPSPHKASHTSFPSHPGGAALLDPPSLYIVLYLLELTLDTAFRARRDTA